MSARAAKIATAVTLLVFAVLVFARLGNYGLWDDEAQTALFGQAVWRTGDTSAVHGHNVLLYRDAVEIDATLHNRLVAPLPYFLEAPFIRVTSSAWWARFPFALAGLATVALLLRWLTELQATRRTWALAILGLVGSVSLILYSRQARYYTLAMLLCTLFVYAYAHRERGKWAIAGMCASGVALCATHYLCYAGLLAAVTVDYLVWGRKTAKLPWRNAAVIVASQLVLCAPIILIWFPLGKDLAQQQATLDIPERLFLWLRTLRDMNNCEYGVGILILVAPLLYRRSGDPLLVQIPMAILIATLVVTLFSPQPPWAGLSDVRYVSFLIPACIVLSVRTIEALRLPGIVAVVAGLLAFQTTILHAPLGTLHPSGKYTVPVRSTLAAYVGELATPPVSSYRLVADWLEANARPRETAIVWPDFATYPLMFHVPKLTYAWQLSDERAAELPPLAPIYLRGKVPPDWIIDFNGPDLDSSLVDPLKALGAAYRRVVGFRATGVDQSRAEMFWHRFDATEGFNQKSPVTIWRRTTP